MRDAMGDSGGSVEQIFHWLGREGDMTAGLTNKQAIRMIILVPEASETIWDAVRVALKRSAA